MLSCTRKHYPHSECKGDSKR